MGRLSENEANVLNILWLIVRLNGNTTGLFMKPRP